MIKEFIFGTDEEVSLHDWLWFLFPYVGMGFIVLSTVWSLNN